MKSDSKSRVVIAAEIFPPAIGGPATHVQLLIPELCKADIAVSAVTYGQDCSTVNTLNIPLACVPLSGNIVVRWVRYFFALYAQAARADTIYALGTVFAGLPAAVVATVRRTRLIVRVPGDVIWEYMRRHGHDCTVADVYNKKQSFMVSVMIRIQRLVINHADAVFTTSQAHADHIRAHWGVSRDVEVVYSPVIPQHRSGDQKENIILSVGRLTAVKGFEQLIHDIQPWLQNNPEWKLVIIGDGPLRADIEQLIASRQLEDQIQLHQAVSQSELQLWYARARAFVLYSEYDAMPHTIVEAMSHNLPIVATQVGGIPEVLALYDNAYLLLEKNTDTLAQQLTQAVTHTKSATISDTLSLAHMIERIRGLLFIQDRRV